MRTNLKLCLVLTILMVLGLTAKQAWGKYDGGSGTANDPYLIYTPEQMNTLGLHSEDWDKHFKLMADIDLGSYTGDTFNVIGTAWYDGFTGVFDGDGHEISNFTYISTDSNLVGGRDALGLFKYVVGGNAEIKNLSLRNPFIDGRSGHSDVGALVGELRHDASVYACCIETGAVLGRSFVGGLVGYSFRGTVSDCHASCNVSADTIMAGGLVGLNDGSISNCYSAGTVLGGTMVGGLVGVNRGTISSDCYSTSDVEGRINVGGLVGCNTDALTNCYAKGNVSGEDERVGGLVGLNFAALTKCHAIGNVSGGADYVGGLVGRNEATISYCFSIGRVLGNNKVGGLVGFNFADGGAIFNCFSTGNVLGEEQVGGLLGYNGAGGGGATVSKCYSSGRVEGNLKIGGLVGDNGGTVEDSFWDIETSRQVWSDGGTGKTTAEMQMKSTFTSAGWDFITPIWTIKDNDYPRLWWEKKILQVPAEYPTIQAAINAAVNGDTVVVATGTYTGNGNRDIDFKGKAITVRSENGPHSCIIDISASQTNWHKGFYLHEGERKTSIIEGFTIKGGYTYEGAGVYCRNSSPTIKNCIITKNTGGWGGGITCYKSNAVIGNCLIVENEGWDAAGGIYCRESNIRMTNCTISGNISNHGGGILCQHASLTITNCILWGNSYRQIEDRNNDSVISVSFSDIKGSWPGEGDINADPLFVDANNGDYHLLPDSPCINAGDPNYVPGPNETDIDGEPRIMNGRIDIGADEYRIVYVDADATGNNDGSSWENAYNYLQDALVDANSSPKPVEIRVAQGIYTPDSNSAEPNGTGDRTATFQLINGVNLKGGYAGFGEPNPDARDIALYETILSGDIGRLSDKSDNCYHVFYHPEGLNLDATAILDGFTITGGNANGSWPHNCGGGMLNNKSSPTVTNCIFSGNSADVGGGMSNGESSPTVEGCTFKANSAGYGGGGMFNGESSPTVEGCTFSINLAGHYGGGMFNWVSSPTVKNCVFRGNSAKVAGGMHNDNYSSPAVEGCTFSANSASNVGGGMYTDYYSTPTVKGCTFSDNSALWAGGMFNRQSNLTVTNCILWADVPSEIYGDPPIVTYSDVQGGYFGVGNINTNPRFVKPVAGDYHLRPDSPCIDAGDPNYVPGPNETDIDGELRVMLGRVDMGADEFNPFEVDFVVVNKRRIGRTIFEYDCSASLHNISRFDVNNIQLELIKAPENMVIIEPNVIFGDIVVRAGQSATSIDTCTFEVDRTKAIEPAEIIWWSRCGLAATGQTMQHTGSSIVLLELDSTTGDITGDGEVNFEDLKILAEQWLGPPGVPSADIAPAPNGDSIVNFLDFSLLAENWQGF